MDYLRKNKKLILLSIGLLFFLSGGSYYFSLSREDNESMNNSFRQNIIEVTRGEDYARVAIKIKDQLIDTEVLFSDKAKSLGLSGREQLADNQGMLFIFNHYLQPSFHMKNMKFPLDLLFIKDGKIVKIFTAAEPEGEMPSKYYSFGPVDMVLELPTPYVEKHTLKEGVSLELNR